MSGCRPIFQNKVIVDVHRTMTVIGDSILMLCIFVAAMPAGLASESVELDKLLERADLMLHLGVL